MSRIAYLLVATLCYFAFFVSFVYLVGFIAGLPQFPTHVDKGMQASVPVAIGVNLLLVSLFGVQHSIMARPGFKQGWTTIVPPALERGFYCLATAVVLAILFIFWHELPQSIWSVSSEVGRTILWALFALGVLTVFVSTWLISHFELFGLAQAWANFRNRPLPTPQFRTPFLYKLVRHPIYLGFFIALWATPDMSLGHLILATGMTLYLFVGSGFEERDLEGQFGTTYVEYQARVSKIIPGLGRKK
ncbi:MAG: isoprenylcysteine carboxylmethyltransferase family protein [Sphingomonadaceae bacterium]|nr:isoprenylcysteine carboxylmethyltransferase family protein [Sphingomonadaceae bacterium]